MISSPWDFDLDDFYMSLKKIYRPRSVEKRKVYSRVQAMTEADIFEKSGTKRRATDDVWSRFTDEAPQIA